LQGKISIILKYRIEWMEMMGVDGAQGLDVAALVTMF